MKGLIVINGYPNGEKFIRQAERIAEELRFFGVLVDVLKNGEVYAYITDEGKTGIKTPCPYDFAVYLDKDKYLGRAMESAGLRLFNRAAAVEICDDKLVTYFALKEAGLPLIHSIPAPLCYTPNAKADENFLRKVASELGFPLVVKESYGSCGAGVHLLHGMPELINKANELLHRPHFYQRFLEKSSGRDIRVIVIGGKAVASMERVAQKGEFRSNVELGGEGRNIELSPLQKEVAERAAIRLGLDYCGVDLLETENGVAICEVNSNAFFEGLERATGINVASLYAKYIFTSMKNGKTDEKKRKNLDNVKIL